MNKIYLTSILLSAATFSFSQRNTVASGGDASGTGGSLSYTAGQVDYTNQISTSGDSNQGVQQPFEFYEITSDIDELNSGNFSIYPNPSNEYLILKTPSVAENLSYTLYDMMGKVISTGDIFSIETKVDTRSYAPGEYHISILSDNLKIESFKIIKNL